MMMIATLTILQLTLLVRMLNKTKKKPAMKKKKRSNLPPANRLKAMDSSTLKKLRL